MKVQLSYRILTPERVIAEGRAESISLPALSGRMTVLPGHEPMLVVLQFGLLKLMTGVVELFQISGGLAEISNNSIKIYLDSFRKIHANEISTLLINNQLKSSNPSEVIEKNSVEKELLRIQNNLQKMG